MSTIRDVAKLAGVSVSTVSRALSGNAIVEEQTKERVMQAVEALNYRPNAIAKGLRQGRLNIVALVIPSLGRASISEMITEMEKELEIYKLTLMVFQTNSNMEQEKKTFQMLASVNIAGVICVTASDDIQHIVDFQQQNGVPVVMINRDSKGRLSSIHTNGEETGFSAVKYLYDWGHRKISVITDDLSRQGMQERYRGYKKALETLGISDSQRFFLYDSASPKAAYAGALELLGRPDPPTAFLIFSDSAIMGVYKAIDVKGLKIPEDVSVVCTAASDIVVDYMIPPATTYDTPQQEVAKAVVSLMRGYWSGQTAPQTIQLEYILTERQSVAPPRKETQAY